MNILMICTGNTCRSSMAEYIGKSIVEELKNEGRIKEDVTISSAGTHALDGDAMSNGALEVLELIGIDGSKHRSRKITKSIISNADVVLTMQSSHKTWIMNNYPELDNVHTLKEYAGIEGEISDPYGNTLSIYEKIRDDIYFALKIALNRAFNIS